MNYNVVGVFTHPLRKGSVRSSTLEPGPTGSGLRYVCRFDNDLRTGVSLTYLHSNFDIYKFGILT